MVNGSALVLGAVGALALLGGARRGSRSGVEAGRQISKLPPELSVRVLKAIDAAAKQAFLDGHDYDNDWCGMANVEYIADTLAERFPLFRFKVAHGGVSVDPSHVYLAVRSASPDFDWTIVDATVRQFLDSPNAGASQRDVARNYPFHPSVPDVAVVPPGHPFYAIMGYNPDWNVATLADPENPDFDPELFDPSWVPGPQAKLWTSFDPVQWISYQGKPWASPRKGSPATSSPCVKAGVQALGYSEGVSRKRQQARRKRGARW